MAFKYTINKIILTLLLLLYQISVISPNYISIPFKIYQEDLTQYITESQIMSEYISNKIYFPIQVGQPYQNVYGTINSLEFELLMKKGDFYLRNPNYDFNYQISNSFSVIADKTLS